jgi:hypothetical protein
VLVGLLAGVACCYVGVLQFSLNRWLGMPPKMPSGVSLESLRGSGAAVAALCDAQPNPIFLSMALVLVLVLFRSLLRRPLLANVVFVVVFAVLLSIGSDSPATDLPVLAVLMSILIFVLLRFGLLAGSLCLFFTVLVQNYPATTDFSAWYAKSMLYGAAVVAGLAIHAARAASRGEAAAVPRRRGH